MRPRNIAIVAAVVVVIPVIGFAWWLLSPLLSDKTVEEEFPFAANAIVPADMTREEVNQVMMTMSKVNETVSEDMPDDMGMTGSTAPAEPTLLTSGDFQDADSFHRGSGQAKIFEGPDGSRLLRLENFEVTNGPALHVILTPHPNPQSQEDVKTPGYVDLGDLKGNRGNQNYPIPDAVDISAQGSVVIYCMPFHVVFSTAELAPQG